MIRQPTNQASNADTSQTTCGGSLATYLRKPMTNSRKIMHQAIGYVGAFLLSWSFYIIVLLANKRNTTWGILSAIFTPMQGFFNFTVFIYPKVLTQLRGNRNYNVWQGFIAVIQSKAISRRTLRHRSNVAVSEIDHNAPTATAHNTTNHTPHQPLFDDSHMRDRPQQDSTLSGHDGDSIPSPVADSRELDTKEGNTNVALEEVANKKAVSFNIKDGDDSKDQEVITATTQEKG
jgi:hypothetical protein